MTEKVLRAAYAGARVRCGRCSTAPASAPRSVIYPVPVHLRPAYRGRVALDPGGLGESERAAREVLSLPMFPELGAADIARVIAAVKAAQAPSTARSKDRPIPE